MRNRMQSLAHLLSASSSTLHFDKLEDLVCEPECPVPTLSDCDCESTRSSCMSLASVLDVVIYEVDPGYSSSFCLSKQGESDPMIIVPASPIGSDCIDIDMDLEYDHAAYTSRIVWTRFPLVHDQ